MYGMAGDHFVGFPLSEKSENVRDSVSTGISGNFAVWQGIFCDQMPFAFVADNKRND